MSAPAPPTNGVDVAFILDNTGSMGAEPLTELRNGISDVLDELEAASGVDYRLALVTPDNDQVHVRLNFSLNNRTAFESALNSDLSAGGGDTPESTDECLNTVLNALAANGRYDPRDCRMPPPPLQIGDFKLGFRPSAVKLVVMITDHGPGGFCDAFDNGTQAAVYAAQARADCVKINAVQVGNNGDATPVMHDYYQTACGWYEQVPANGTGIVEAVVRMFYVSGYCNCP